MSGDKDLRTPMEFATFRLALIVAAAFFMENLDGTVIVTALPQIAHSFHVTATDLSLGVTAYLLTVAAFVPTSGWAADRFGSRTVFACAIILFTVASILCGLANGFWSFIAARVLQGFAASLMSPVGRLVVIRTSRKSDLVRAIGTLTWPALIAPVLGPLVGGFITTYADWRWIFFLNVPLGVVGAALAFAYVPEHKETKRSPFDTPGFLLTGTSLASFLYGLDLLSRHDAAPVMAAILVAAGAILGVLAIRHAQKAATPLLDLRSLDVGSFVLTTISSGALSRISIMATPFLLPLMFQLTFGLSPVKAGVLVSIYLAGNLVTKTITTPLMRLTGFRPLLVVNGLLAAVSLFCCALLTPSTPTWWLYLVLFATGSFRSINFTAMGTLAFAEIKPERKSGATALWGVMQQLSFSLGVALAAVALNASLTFRGAPVLQVIDFRMAFFAIAIMAAVSGLWFAKLTPGVGAEISGHVHKPRGQAKPKLEGV